MRRVLLRTAFALLLLMGLLPGMSWAAPAPPPKAQKITVTLVRWPYT